MSVAFSRLPITVTEQPSGTRTVAYVADCNAVTMLYCIHAPAKGGETHFCDLVAAYEALDEVTKSRIENVYATQKQFVTTHRYRVGDVVLRDNTQTLHAAEPIGPAVDDSTKRLLRRIVATGLPPLLAS